MIPTEDFKETGVQMKLAMADSSMAQFAYGVDGVHLREAVSVVSYPVQLIPVSIRSSMCTFVSHTNCRYSIIVTLNSQWTLKQ